MHVQLNGDYAHKCPRRITLNNCVLVQFICEMSSSDPTTQVNMKITLPHTTLTQHQLNPHTIPSLTLHNTSFYRKSTHTYTHTHIILISAYLHPSPSCQGSPAAVGSGHAHSWHGRSSAGILRGVTTAQTPGQQRVPCSNYEEKKVVRSHREEMYVCMHK